MPLVWLASPAVFFLGLNGSMTGILDDVIGETATDLRDAMLLFEASPFLLSTDDRLARFAFVFAKELAVGA